MLTSSYFPPKEQYDADITLVNPGVSDVGDEPSIYQNFFNDSCSCPYINNTPTFNTQIFNPAILKSYKKIDNGAESNDASDDSTTVQP